MRGPMTRSAFLQFGVKGGAKDELGRGAESGLNGGLHDSRLVS